MKKIIDYFVDNSVVVNLLTVLVILLGSYSIITLNKETFPNVDFNFVVIRYSYPGAATEDVEKLVALDVEKALKVVDGVEELNTISGENGLIVSIKVDPEYNVDEVLQDTQTAVDSISTLPEDVEEPVVTKINNKNRGLMNIAIWGKGEKELRKISKRIQKKLELESNISSVELSGYRDEVFKVKANPELLNLYDISLMEIVAAIKDRQINISAGSTKNKKGEKLIRTLNELESKEDIENIIVRSNDIGKSIQVKDLAKVEFTFKDWDRFEKAEKEQAIFLDIKAKSSADVIDTSKIVKDIFKVEAKKEGIQYKIFDDLSFYVKRRLSVLTQNGLQGIILVTICLYLFMNFRVSVITALGAPFAFLVAFSLMGSLDITINLISMFGLILVLGMLVDDSIIVSEQYYQNLENGLSPKAAAKKAALETLAPVTATVLTTMVAFGSLFYMDGIMGKFLWPVPAVVIIALAASWIECFIMLPGHLADFAPKIKVQKNKAWYEGLKKFYKRGLEFSLRYSKSTIFAFSILFFLSAIVAFKMRFELFPSDDVVITSINIKSKVGTSLERTKEEIDKIEKIVTDSVKESELTGIRSSAGFQFFQGGRSKSGSHYGSIYIELVMSDLRERSVDEIMSSITDRLKKEIKDFEFSVTKFTGGPPKGEAIKVLMLGEDKNELLELSRLAKKEITKLEGVSSLELDFEDGKKQILVRINNEEARRLNVENINIAMEIRNAYEGVSATTIKKSDEDLDVLVQLNDESRKDSKVLENLKITNKQGLRINLSAIAKFEEVPGAYIIRRKNRRKAFSLIGDVDLTKSTPLEINKKIKAIMQKLIKDFPDIIFSLEGENKDTLKSLRSALVAFACSVFIIFIMLVIQFTSMARSLIIISAIPFSLIGVVAAFLILDLPIGFMALMGILGLVGVVVNDSIVLVTFISRAIEKDKSFGSLVSATVSRFRPVILTTLTTVSGLLPVAHMTGGDPFLKPMATSFAYGLLFSSLITLIFVPCCYKVYIDFTNYMTSKKSLKA